MTTSTKTPDARTFSRTSQPEEVPISRSLGC